jgi:hypothetical protein
LAAILPSSYLHLAVIPAEPFYELNYNTIMWWVPTTECFVQSMDARVSGLGLMAVHEMDLLKGEKEALFQNTRAFLQPHGLVTSP